MGDHSEADSDRWFDWIFIGLWIVLVVIGLFIFLVVI